MEGVILFADNKVFEDKSFENNLFIRLKSDDSMSVLPISTLTDLERTMETISTFKALILDWNFNQDIEDDDDVDGVEMPVATPETMLHTLDIYSLIYIYSQTEIPQETRQKLELRFANKIQFRKKGEPNKVDEEYENIRNDIERFEQEHKHMEIPFIWSLAINRSVQQIFGELEQADPNWIKEIRDTAISDGGEPTSDVIDIFHHILDESLIQNKTLRKALDEYTCDKRDVSEENTAKLYRRIYYSLITEESPIMTGDIFKFSEDEYGILITPECEINSVVKEVDGVKTSKKDVNLEFLIFTLNSATL